MRDKIPVMQAEPDVLVDLPLIVKMVSSEYCFALFSFPTACPTQCDTGARRCFGRGENDCCNFYGLMGECLQACDIVEDDFTCRGML